MLKNDILLIDVSPIHGIFCVYVLWYFWEYCSVQHADLKRLGACRELFGDYKPGQRLLVFLVDLVLQAKPPAQSLKASILLTIDLSELSLFLNVWMRKRNRVSNSGGSLCFIDFIPPRACESNNQAVLDL